MMDNSNRPLPLLLATFSPSTASTLTTSPLPSLPLGMSFPSQVFHDDLTHNALNSDVLGNLLNEVLALVGEILDVVKQTLDTLLSGLSGVLSGLNFTGLLGLLGL